jgi:DNA-directed RNA polymerase subunit M
MEFCPKCGTRLIPKRPKEGAKGGAVLVCPKCGYKKKLAKRIEPIPKVIEHSPQKTIAVISKREQKLRVLPTVRVECPKCQNNLAYAWQVQTRGSDESSTQFFRCTKCNHTFREYS